MIVRLWIVIPLVLIGIIGVQDANFVYGLTCDPIAFDERIKETPLIFSGNLISIEQSNKSQNELIANFQVLEIFKGSNTNHVSLATFEDDFFGIHFEEGQKYIVHAEFFNNVLSIDHLCGLTSKFNTEEADNLRKIFESSSLEIESPKKQMNRGISVEDVLCREGLELVIRTNGFAACVRAETAERMQKAGMLFVPIKFTDLEKESKPVTASETEIQTVPASGMSTINFYITDHDLNLEHSGIEIVSTEGLFEFTINGNPIIGPESMIETGPDTGQFYVKLELPETINGNPLSQDDIVLIKYLDESDFSGEQRVLVKSVSLTKTLAKVQTSEGGSRIGHEFIVRIYEPDANRDSKDEDKISLNELEFRGEGGIRVTLDDPKFDANREYLIETGPNTSMFEVQIKIPREIDGKTIHIGDEYEIRYIDKTTPSNTDEKVVLKGKIG